MPLRPPVLSELDLLLESEGSIDPLGLQATYERLADRILPAITVRMTRPRFLTAMAVGARVCEEWGDEDLAKDGSSPAWIVFEWLVIESFVRCRQVLTDGQRIAGILKVGRAIREHGHLSAATYLKTPKVFGFSGVFKRLAVAAGVLTEDFRLDDAGFSLVRAWEEDRKLIGFLDSRDGPGAKFRGRLQAAVRQAMEKGGTTAQNTAFWEELATHLEPGSASRKEKGVLYQIIRSGSRRELSTGELVDALEKRGSSLEFYEEAGFLRSVERKASEDLRPSLVAIDAYERLCRPISDALNLIRHLSAQLGPVGPADFAAQKKAGELVARTQEGVEVAAGCRQLLEWEEGVRDLVDDFREADGPQELFQSLISRHEKAQREKPPHGKRPWVEHDRGSAVIVRPAYVIGELEEEVPPYVHDYRTPTLSRFLGDLGRYS